MFCILLKKKKSKKLPGIEHCERSPPLHLSTPPKIPEGLRANKDGRRYNTHTWISGEKMQENVGEHFLER